MNSEKSQAQGQLVDLALHTLGWKAFQDLCAQVCEEVLQRPVAIYREAQDGGQDAVFLFKKSKGLTGTGTVQCKFTSDSKRRLKLSDLNVEKVSIKELVAKGEADTYYFITNMGVDAPVAVDIRTELTSLGVSNPEIFGREWITQQIRESSRLRALVPRVYGLGDLSVILDERRAEQTQALLGHLIPSLSVYVPTSAHRQAVRVLKEHGIVLLLGPPAAGKSMLAAILATSALDDGNHRCFQVDSPQELLEHWNPNEPGGFYWIDDAFGPNQLREDFVDQWISMMSKVKTAISRGNRFVLTSRSHIWNAAKQKLATRNHPLLADNTAIVDVGMLSPEERSQILYNHIKAGNQTKEWKSQVKPFLDDLSKKSNLLPEIARRLGNKSYTSGLTLSSQDLEKFVNEPMEYLKETVGELNDAQRAALTLVFLNKSKLSADVRDHEAWSRVCDKFGVSQVEIGDALEQLNDTFIVRKQEKTGSFWSFSHPTISDALSSILGYRNDLVELYLRGVRIGNILSDVVCENAKIIRDAIVVPESLNDLLVERLLETENEININRMLFSFLNSRASENVLKTYLKQDLSVLSRSNAFAWRLNADDKIHLQALAHKYGLLPPDLREKSAEYIERKIVDDLDCSILDNDEVLGLIPASRYFSLVIKLRTEIQESIEDRIETILDEADLETDPDDSFYEVNRFLSDMEEIMSEDDDVREKISELQDQMEEAITELRNKVRDWEEEWVGEDVVPEKVTKPISARSLFSDIDE